MRGARLLGSPDSSLIGLAWPCSGSGSGNPVRCPMCPRWISIEACRCLAPAANEEVKPPLSRFSALRSTVALQPCEHPVDAYAVCTHNQLLVAGGSRRCACAATLCSSPD